MGTKQRAKGPYGLAEEFRKFSEEKRFSEAFFRKLDELAKKRVKKRHWSPWQLGFPSDDWDEDSIHELAMEFLTEHLVAEGQSRLKYLLDRASSNEVDSLMMTIFDQFLAERAKAISPHRSNLRARIKGAMAKLVDAGEAQALPGQSVSWAPAGTSSNAVVQLHNLMAQVGKLPAFHKRVYKGEQRVSPEVSEKELHRILSSIFDHVRGRVELDTLTDFLCRLLDVRDPAFDSVQDMEDEAEEREAGLPPELARALSEMGEAEAQARLKQALARLSDRQRKIFRMNYIEGRSVPEICASLKVKKSVVYDEMQRIEAVLLQ